MCLICVEWSANRMTFDEMVQAAIEATKLKDEEHTDTLVKEIFNLNIED